jgi:Short C-terminal domain
MGLLKTGMKAVVAVKTADVIHERIQRRQQEQWVAYGHPGGMAPAGVAGSAHVPPAPAAGVTAAPVPPAAAVPAAADTGSVLAQLKQLGDLRTSGVLTEAEFELQKARILSG